ncbi:Aminodeoxychorismate synthase component 2 [Caulifigura coniformis]|uniref:Aminodeoxychorismate synthase component 2 n=1 Tax=Caulifigura coniformis TaxID=2527983 RepID=A0A517SK39_9PLAN|nr:aminodeoxychorismate/anthranilate synthase component II [Caulifigura coniformis]QDT56493.1 Aminodeoxychorismate synthase component 2 [Caulifigura coniformis]
MILLIDNYDSFVFNLARYVEELGVETQVVRNDAITVEAIERLQPQAIILSPGPCGPRDSGVCLDVVAQLGPSIPILGVCLGHQAIAYALGGRVVESGQPVHGHSSLVRHTGEGLFAGLPSPLQVGRYHSLVAEPDSLPADLEVTARTEDGVVMAIRHRKWPLSAVQFHPESVLTVGGHTMLANFLTGAGCAVDICPPGDLPPGQSPPDFYALPVEWPSAVVSLADRS